VSPDNTHALTVWFTLEVSPIGMVSKMVIETDLHLNVRHPQHAATAVNDLLMTARAYFVANANHVTNIGIMSIRHDQVWDRRAPSR
jgi:hypothetical protein